MTLNSFKTKTKIYNRSGWIAAGFILLGIALAAISVAFVKERDDQGGSVTTSIAILALSFPLSAAIILYCLARYPLRLVRRLGLACPICSKPLVGASADVVLDTGRCGHCGGQVLQSDERLS